MHGVCSIPTSPTLGALSEMVPVLLPVAGVVAVALFATWFFLNRLKVANAAGILFVLHGVVYYLVAVALVSLAFSIPFSFMLLLLPAFFIFGIAFGMVFLPMLLWWMNFRRSRAFSAPVHGLLVLLFVGGAVGAVAAANLLAPSPAGGAHYSRIEFLDTSGECFGKGGASFQVSEGDHTKVYFSDGTTKTYPRNGY